MKVRIVTSGLTERQGGVSTYLGVLRERLPAEGVEVVDGDDFDVLLHAGPHSYDGLSAAGGRRSVMVVHDLIPEVLWKDEGVRKERERALAAVDAVIAISECTKADILREYGISPEKVHVVHDGVGEEFFERGADPSSVPFPSGRYLLYVGKRNEYKRFRWFLRAVAPFMWRHPSLRILCTGEPFCRREWAWIVGLGLWGRVRSRRFTADEMPAVYANAMALVYPSIYEGFGLPILEAMAAACPVVCARASCLPEVAGDAAAYFEQDDGAGLRAVLNGLLPFRGGAAERRAEWIEKGKARAKCFSWNKCAHGTAEVLAGVGV